MKLSFKIWKSVLTTLDRFRSWLSKPFSVDSAYMGVGRGGKACSPWIFIHDIANVFFNKHSLFENIPTLTNHLGFCTVLVDVKRQVRLRPSGGLSTRNHLKVSEKESHFPFQKTSNLIFFYSVKVSSSCSIVLKVL